MKKPSERLWNYCEICKHFHYPVEVYRRWLLKHGDKGKVFKSSGRKSRQQEQIERWRGIVERHGTRADATIDVEED